MLNANILKRVNAQINRRTKQHTGGTIQVLPDAEPLLNVCVSTLNAIEMPEDARQALYYKLLGDSLASHPAQDVVNLIVAQRMLKELQNTERIENSIVYIKRTLAPDSL